jgi:uncharacterized membrane protein YdjX (TVP38/TMEM64 family)
VNPALVRVGALGLLAGGGFVSLLATGSVSVGRVRDWADGWGLAGPVLFVMLSSLLTVALFPGPLLAGASGLLFGTGEGTAVSIVAATVGACLAFCLARTVAHDAVAEHGGARVARVREWVARRGFAGIFLLRVAPGVPYNLVNYGAGLTRLPLGVFALATAIGCSPRAFAYTALGGQLGSFSSWQTVVAVAVIAVMAVIGLGLIARDEELREGVRRIVAARRSRT